MPFARITQSVSLERYFDYILPTSISYLQDAGEFFGGKYVKGLCLIID